MMLLTDMDAKCRKVKELKAAIGPLSGRSSQFTTDACYRRYLEAGIWNLHKAQLMLEETLTWRSSYKPEEIRWRLLRRVKLVVYRANFKDREGRTVLVLRPGKQNTSVHANQLRHLVYLLENAILNLREGQEQMMWLIDFSGWSLANSVPVKIARETINILQNHYPERLGVAFLYNPPRIFETFWKIVKYFLDTKTFQKVRFVYPKNKESREPMHKYFDAEILPEEFGGKNKIDYNHDEFSKMITKDGLKSATFWGLDGKPAQPKQASNAEAAPEPSHDAAKHAERISSQ